MSDSDYFMICANIFLAASFASNDTEFGRPMLLTLAAVYFLGGVFT